MILGVRARPSGASATSAAMGPFFCLLALGLLNLTGRAAPGAGPSTPNVVILLADDLGWKDLGCYGGPVRTPAIDGLAARGVRFTDFHAGAAVCSPSRATLLTGRQHIRSGVYSWIADHVHKAHLLESEVTLAEVLKRHGYRTAHFGKWHLGMPSRERAKPTPSDHGFDYWFATANNAAPSQKDPVNFVRNGRPAGRLPGYACQLVVDEAMAWLDKLRDQKAPFFLNVWFHEPHAPLAAPPELVAHYGEAGDPAAVYSATIENTDRAIARLLARLEQIAPARNTLIFYSSDNGSYRADRVGGLRGIKGSNFEGGLRVPGIFSWPGHFPAGQVEDEPAGLVDVLPTLCGLLGIPPPAGVALDGADLTALLTGRRRAEFVRAKPLFWLLPTSQPAAAIRDGRYSLMAYRAYRLPKDRERLAALRQRIEETLRRNGTLAGEIRGSTLDRQMFEGFHDPEAEKLRGAFIRLNMFQEAWIPRIKHGRFDRFELYDLATDRGQRRNVWAAHPDVGRRLRDSLRGLVENVCAEGPEW